MFNRIKNWLKNPSICVYEVGVRFKDENLDCSEYFLTHKSAEKYAEKWNNENKDKEFSLFIGGVPLYLW